MRIKMSSKIMPVSHLIKRLGIDERGQVQDFLTSRVLFHMRSFMPWRSGETASALTRQQSPTLIVVDAPYARYLYYGMKMRDPNGGGPFPIKDANGEFQGEFRYRKGSHPVSTGVPFEYTLTTNEHAGPYWDRTLMQFKSAQIKQEVEEYIRKKQ